MSKPNLKPYFVINISVTFLEFLIAYFSKSLPLWFNYAFTLGIYILSAIIFLIHYFLYQKQEIKTLKKHISEIELKLEQTKLDYKLINQNLLESMAEQNSMLNSSLNMYDYFIDDFFKKFYNLQMSITHSKSRISIDQFNNYIFNQYILLITKTNRKKVNINEIQNSQNNR